MNKEKNEWVEVTKDKMTCLLTEEINKKNKTFFKETKGKQKIKLLDKLKGAELGQRFVKTVVNTFGKDFLEARIVTEGFKKCEKKLNKGNIIQFDNFRLKLEENKYYTQEC